MSITVVNLMTSSYSGATWLCMVLGSHPRVFAVGEIDHLVKANRKSQCSTHGLSCPVWSRVQTRNGPELYLDIARAAGKDILVVNKARKLLDAQDDPRIERRFLFMPRDGRACVASRLRKYEDVGTWEACRWWSRSIRKKERLVRRAPADHVLELRYERVVADQPNEVGRICAFLGLGYEPDMLNWAEHEHCAIGGNTGVQSTRKRIANIAEASDEPADPDTDPRRREKREKIDAYYRTQDPTNFVDERWRRELSPAQQRVFWLRAGLTNRRYGYPAGWPSADSPSRSPESKPT